MGYVKADDEWKRGMTKPSVDFIIAAQNYLQSCSGDAAGVLRYAMKKIRKGKLVLKGTTTPQQFLESKGFFFDSLPR